MDLTDIEYITLIVHPASDTAWVELTDDEGNTCPLEEMVAKYPRPEFGLSGTSFPREHWVNLLKRAVTTVEAHANGITYEA